MSDFYTRYQFLIEPGMISAILALSQFIVLKAGVFSVAPVGLAAISGYTTAILQLDHGVNPWTSMVVGITAAVAVSLLLAIPLAHLRGIFQAIATLSFVIVVQSSILVFGEITGGPSGLNGIPKTQTTASVSLLLLGSIVFCALVGRSRVGKAFDALRQDEIAAASHGIAVFRFQLAAFAISGVLAGLSGALTANYSYSLVPEQFSFQTVVSVLTFVVIGGVARLPGPILGTMVLLALPEFVRPLEGQRLIVNGLLLIAISIYLPRGLYDSAVNWLRYNRARTTATSSSPRDGGELELTKPEEVLGS